MCLRCHFKANKETPWAYFMVPPLLPLKISAFPLQTVWFQGELTKWSCRQKCVITQPRRAECELKNPGLPFASISHTVPALCTRVDEPQQLNSGGDRVGCEVQMLWWNSLTEICPFTPSPTLMCAMSAAVDSKKEFLTPSPGLTPEHISQPYRGTGCPLSWSR